MCRTSQGNNEASHKINFYLQKDATSGSSCVYHGLPVTRSCLHQSLNKQANIHIVNRYNHCNSEHQRIFASFRLTWLQFVLYIALRKVKMILDPKTGRKLTHNSDVGPKFCGKGGGGGGRLEGARSFPSAIGCRWHIQD